MVSCIAEILHNEDVALGLAQPQGIGQRPRHLSVDLTTGQPTLVQVLRFKNKIFFLIIPYCYRRKTAEGNQVTQCQLPVKMTPLSRAVQVLPLQPGMLLLTVY